MLEAVWRQKPTGLVVKGIRDMTELPTPELPTQNYRYMFPSFFTRLSSSVLGFSAQNYAMVTFEVCEGQTGSTEQYVRL